MVWPARFHPHHHMRCAVGWVSIKWCGHSGPPDLIPAFGVRLRWSIANWFIRARGAVPLASARPRYGAAEST
jgi:hypothetical protein